ncbi:MAG: hypothetical protein ACYCOX_16030 [Acidobacteriaceae bacterium]
MTAQDFAELARARPAGAGKWQARCPAHEDRSPSLSIAEGRNGRILIRCWAGCETKDVLAAFGLTFKDISPELTRAGRAALALRRAEEARARYREIVIFISSAARGLAARGDIVLANEYRSVVRECSK